MPTLMQGNNPIGVINKSGGGGHVILDQNGNALDQELNMQFVDAHTSDDSVNTKTVIENIKSATEADFRTATEDGLYDVDVEGAEIGEISEDYVEVTGDGVKTYATLLNELYAQIDFEKITPNSYIRGLQDIFFLRRITSNLLIFSGFRISATNGYYESINLESNNSTIYLSTYTKSSGNWTIDNETNSIVSSGIKLTLYYGNDKAVVDLQTTANRCLMLNGQTVQEKIATIDLGSFLDLSSLETAIKNKLATMKKGDILTGVFSTTQNFAPFNITGGQSIIIQSRADNNSAIGMIQAWNQLGYMFYGFCSSGTFTWKKPTLT